jgi:hypothetical protein
MPGSITEPRLDNPPKTLTMPLISGVTVVTLQQSALFTAVVEIEWTQGL